jgi:hypothetical protein
MPKAFQQVTEEMNGFSRCKAVTARKVASNVLKR